MGSPATFNLPETPAGQAAASWPRMLNQSDVKAMRSYIRNAMAPAPMDDLALDERLESYRKLHVRLGFLRPVGVQASAPYEITLVFRSVHQQPLVLVFAVEQKEAFRLLSVKARE